MGVGESEPGEPATEGVTLPVALWLAPCDPVVLLERLLDGVPGGVCVSDGVWLRLCDMLRVGLPVAVRVSEELALVVLLPLLLLLPLALALPLGEPDRVCVPV